MQTEKQTAALQIISQTQTTPNSYYWEIILQIVPKFEIVRKYKLMMYDNLNTLRSSEMALRNDGDDGRYVCDDDGDYDIDYDVGDYGRDDYNVNDVDDDEGG